MSRAQWRERECVQNVASARGSVWPRGRRAEAYWPGARGSRGAAPGPRPAPRSNRRIKIWTFLYESVSFSALIVNFFRATSPLFRLPEMIFFAFDAMRA